MFNGFGNVSWCRFDFKSTLLSFFKDKIFVVFILELQVVPYFQSTLKKNIITFFIQYVNCIVKCFGLYLCL